MNIQGKRVAGSSSTATVTRRRGRRVPLCADGGPCIYTISIGRRCAWKMRGTVGGAAARSRLRLCNSILQFLVPACRETRQGVAQSLPSASVFCPAAHGQQHEPEGVRDGAQVVRA